MNSHLRIQVADVHRVILVAIHRVLTQQVGPGAGRDAATCEDDEGDRTAGQRAADRGCREGRDTGGSCLSVGAFLGVRAKK